VVVRFASSLSLATLEEPLTQTILHRSLFVINNQEW